ncbi:hypothetical protein BG015_007763 [Linnemannia schmuckeri]|uniref:Uncharacterized protein n=1 Tax=Linnemannia schmuckeri TaxID=64567 RepID=A0A9P5RY13_9FUNG|nr:hypothetical protein BG015_007763 [Linnemannia schmuckeri]
MTVPHRTRGQSPILVLFTLLFAFFGIVAALDPQSSVPTATSSDLNPAFLSHSSQPTITGLYKRQATANPLPDLPGTNTTTLPPTNTTSTVPLPTPSTNTTSLPPALNTTSLIITTTISRTATSVSVNATSVSTSTASVTPTTTEPSSGNSDNKGLVIGGSVVGGLVFAIGLALLAFRCTINSREKKRRNKEMAATLAESFDRSGGDPIASPRKGYMELGDGPPAPGPGRGANLSRNGSQDAYYGKEGGGQDYYSSHYVQERYGGANTGGGYYDETELSVMNGHPGRPASPFVGRSNSDHSMAYPPTSISTNHYAGYNEYGHNGDYDYHGGNHDGGGGYYGGGGHGGRPQGY